MIVRNLLALSLPVSLALVPAAAHAYVGPGAGLTAIGTVVALGLALILAIVGFVWYPMRRMLRARRAKADGQIETAPEKTR